MEDRKEIRFLNSFLVYTDHLDKINADEHLLISTLNSYSLILSQKDDVFRHALIQSDILLPDGISIVLAARFLYGYKFPKIAGADLFYYQMSRLNKNSGKCFFLGSSDVVLNLICKRASIEFPNVTINTYSPPFKTEFSVGDNLTMVETINHFCPDVLFIGLTAPKQEKWAFAHFQSINAKHVCSIGAVFDFYAGTVKRAPVWMIKSGLEWCYRLISEPRRLWRRYLLGNIAFIWLIIKNKFIVQP